MPKIPDVTWHAGAMHTRANTLRSIKKAVDGGAQIVEFDVTFRPDSTPVIIHLASPNPKQGVALEDALKIVAKSSSCRINLDLKAYSNLPAVDALVEKHGLMSRVFFTGVFEENTAEVKATSIIPYYLNAYGFEISKRSDAEYLADYAEKIKACGAIGFNAQFLNISPACVEVMHKHGLLVSAWTANDTATQKRMIDAGVDNITTKRPDRLRKLLKTVVDKS